MLLEINPINPQPRKIEQVVDLLRRGGVIAYPTDTIHGIGCDILNKRAIERVYQIKQRPKNQPFSFICSDLKNISQYAKVSNYAYKTMRRLLPGPYTFILEGANQVPKMMLTKRKTAGIRVPDNPICMAIISALGNPIISTSATTASGELFNEPWLIEAHFGKQLDLVIDGGAVPGEPSSVVSLIGDEPEIIRQGLGDIASLY
ncbi:MAG: threonylcarbamoyl-AMP synthase [Desulfatitalea sp.]|nr:threonylcarbamoyl-AMP synthase [Desulfatitalea sp.]NNK02665.1 threonylcarbamoyl-AMP synthase [Desulfatitalea sp.]